VLPAAPRERLTLPTLAATSPRPGFPLVATLAPVVVSLVLWMLTQSIYSLLFAFLGPVVALGSLLDAKVNRRRAALRERARFLAALAETAESVATAHDRERERLARVSPDPAAAIGWAVAGRPGTRGRPVPLRIGQGTIAGRVDLSGEDPEGDESAAAGETVRAVRAVRSAAAELHEAPIVVDARDGIGVTGPPVLAACVARALAVRLAARLSPADAGLAAPAGEVWVEQLPHEVTVGAADRYLWTEGDGEPVVISWAESEAGLPLGCGIRIAAGAEGGVAGDRVGEDPRDARPDALTSAEAAIVVQAWRERAASLGLRPPGSDLPSLVRLADLLPLASHPEPGAPSPASLAAPVGRDAQGAVVLDLVAQGPHAVVAGTTGSGKSELLVSWILGMAAARSPDEVAFLLVDFKGGSAFAPLAVLPHVLATLSDLDARLTRRAIESLRAELLHRERVLAAAAARSIDELPVGALPRLVIVVDEYAALVSASPELHEVFGDLAARGRSLGLHLILCTQRPAGVIRDAVLANVTLRLSLRVTDRGDSAAMLGDDAAFRLPAEPRGRGVVAGDGGPRMLQVAIAEPSDALRIAAGSVPATLRRPWLDPLPREIALDGLPAAERGLGFGLLDLPAEQRQPAAAWDPERHGHLLALGAAGSGSTTLLQALAVSAARAGLAVQVVPPGPADAWQLLSLAVERPGVGQHLLLIDDLDALVAAFDADYRHEFLELLTAVARGGSGSGCSLAVAAHRLTGPLAGLAGLFGSRLLLRQTSRDEHVLAGGDPRTFDPELPPGAGTWRGDVVQVARPAEADRLAAWATTALDPIRVDPAEHAIIAVVAARPRALRERLSAGGARIVELGSGSEPAPGDLRVSGGTVPTVVLGDPDAWLAEWALLSTARRDWPIILVGVTSADHRALLRDRALPPPLGQRPGECWLSIDGRTERAVLALS
jgi:S-DNA-T family DNA segregation ATPase FtsK/SpoIIIE